MLEIVKRKTEDLIPYARNARTHSAEQVAQIAGSIKEFGFNNPVLIDQDGGIIAGHGRVLAAQKLGLKEIPTITLGHLSETQKRAYILADNKLALNAGWDQEMLKLEIADLGKLDVDLDMIGFDLDDITELTIPDIGGKGSDGSSGGLSDQYTQNIKVPIYTPKGENPPVSSLTDSNKTEQLKSEIIASDIEDEVKKFLLAAADRHTVFHFRRIAEFYCHASPKVQALMEKSGLVLIDLNKAIENGFVRMTKELCDIADRELENGDA